MSGIEAALTGRVGRDPEVRTAKTGKTFATIAIAIGSDDATTWVKVICFGSIAEQVAAEVKKADAVYCEGNLKLESWTGRDGQPRTGITIFAAKLTRCEIGRAKPKKQRKPKLEEPQRADVSSGADLPDDPIPF